MRVVEYGKQIDILLLAATYLPSLINFLSLPRQNGLSGTPHQPISGNTIMILL
jgi:hypothetical protein